MVLKWKIIPAIGIKLIGSCVEAHLSIMIWEKFFGSKLWSAPLARTKEPAVRRVQTKTRKRYKNCNDGNCNASSLRLHTGFNFRLMFALLNDFAYSLYNSLSFKTSFNRSAISSDAAFEFAHTNKLPLVVRTICSIAATSVLVLPVPI